MGTALALVLAVFQNFGKLMGKKKERKKEKESKKEKEKSLSVPLMN